MSISFILYGADWMARPGVMVLLALSALVFFTPLVKSLRQGGIVMLRPSGRMDVKLEDASHLFFIAIGVAALVTAQNWYFLARIGPTVVAGILGGAALLSLTYTHPPGSRERRAEKGHRPPGRRPRPHPRSTSGCTTLGWRKAWRSSARTSTVRRC